MALGSTGPIEAKVSWASIAATVLTGLVFAANHTDAIPGYTGWPAWVKGVLSVLVIAGGTFGSGYAAPHTPRQTPAAAGTRPAQRADLEQGLPGSNVHKAGETWTTGGYPGEKAPTDPPEAT